MSIIALAQGIPFFHAADDLLRSKDMDQNSYDSGDWFNKIDWTYQSNNWGIGLAVASENEAEWPIHQPLLADPSMPPTPDDINWTRGVFQEWLRIRMSSGLFRMHTATEVQSNLQFLNTGPNQTARLIAMLLRANGGNYGPYSTVAVVFNANTQSVTVDAGGITGLALHPVQAASVDPVVRQAQVTGSTLTAPGLTTAVFVKS